MAWYNYRLRGNTNKYHNSKIIIDGMRFDSKKEAFRYTDLKLMQKAGEIRDLQMQVKFVLIPTQRDEKTGKLLEKECAYYADFTYYDRKGQLIVEDVKSPITRQNPEYVIKRKLLLFRYGIHITEI